MKRNTSSTLFNENWACLSCTFVNIDDDNSCKMRDNTNPISGRVYIPAI